MTWQHITGPLTNNNSHARKTFFKSILIRYIFPLDYDLLHGFQFIII